jgi:hypothetical protein
MVSDQGQALETAQMFTSYREHPFKMKIHEWSPINEPRPSIYVGGKQVTEF